MRIFISFSGNDRDIKDKIVAELRKSAEYEDTEVWESDGSCITNFGDECIKAIRESQIFIILISKHSMASGSYCLDEVIEAHNQEGQQKLNILIYNVDGTPLKDDFKFNLNHISESNRVHRLAGNESAGIAELAKRANHLLKLRNDGTPELYIPDFDAVRPQSEGFFVEGSRDTVFKEIENAFEKSNVVFLEQITGFGKKSAARKYAESFAKLYENVFYFPAFCGSIRDFLLNGLKVKNMVDMDFEILSEEQRLMKKSAILSGLDNKTLLIVPEIISDSKDDQLVFDILFSAKCRIIFITQSIPRTLRDRFPCVFVDRMKDEHLFKIFFHYYDRNSDEDTQQLEKPLLNFFDSIGGHTKTVELTAKSLDDEFIFPDQVPELLENITTNSKEGLAGSISDAISNLFGIKNFDETDRNILWCASVLANMPIDEKDFIELLKRADCFDAKKLKALIESKWIDENKSSSLISVNSFLSGVCISKIKPSLKVAEACCDKLYFDLVVETSGMKYGTVFRLYSICAELFSSLGLVNTAKATKTMATMLERADAYSKEEIETFIDMINEELENSEYRECVKDLIDMITETVKTLNAIISVPADRSDSFNVRAIQELLVPYKSALLELCETADPNWENKNLDLYYRIKTLVEHVAEDPISSVAAVISFIELIARNDEEIDASDSFGVFIIYGVLRNILHFMAGFLSDTSSYMLMKILKEWRKLAKIFGGFNSNAESFIVNYNELRCRTDLGILDEKTYECYEHAKNCLEDALKEFKIFENDTCGDFANSAKDYMNLLEKNGDIDKAKKILYDLIGLKSITLGSINCIAGATHSLAVSFIGNGEKEHAVKIISDAVNYMESSLKKVRGNADDLQETEKKMSFLKDMITVIELPQQEDDIDENVEYENYYKLNPLKTDGKMFSVFEKIAKEADQLDYSNFDSKGITEKRIELEKRAESGEKPEKLASEAFALADEVGYRIHGYHHRYVQYLGAAVMIGRNIAEMQNGEGKTYTLTLVAFLYALYGNQVHIVDTSNYLCKRNFAWMRGIYEALGYSVGLITESDDVANACECRILYTTLSEEMFLRMRADFNPENPAFLIKRDILIADEADMLIDQATQMFSLSSGESVNFDRLKICKMAKMIVDFADESPNKNNSYSLNGYNVILNAGIYETAEKCNIDYIALTPLEKTELDSALRVYIRVKHIYREGKDFFIYNDGDGMPTRVGWENKYTGELESFGKYYAYFILTNKGINEAEAAKYLDEKKILDTMNVWSLVRSFKMVCGATATGASISKLFKDYFDLNVYRIPTAKAIRRIEHFPRMYTNADYKNDAIKELVRGKAEKRQPVLVVCETTFDSVQTYKMLTDSGIKATLLNAENPEDRPELLANAGKLGAVTVTTSLANRGVDICLGGNPGNMAKKELLADGTDSEMLEKALFGAAEDNDELYELRIKYNFLSSVWNIQLAREREEIEALGGLCVIGTLCFSDIRAEQQMIGRCARQGSPGESYIFYSITDESVARFFSEEYRSFFLNMLGDSYIEVGRGRMGKLFNKALISSREKNMKYEFGFPDRSFDALFLAPNRGRFRKPVYIAYSKESDPGEVLRFIIDSSQIFLQSIKEIAKKNKAKVKSKSIMALADMGYDLSFSSQKTSDKLYEYVIGICEKKFGNNLSEILKRFTALKFNKAWENYIETADAEYKSINSRNHVSYSVQFAKEYGNSLYDETVDKVIFSLITAIVKKADDSQNNHSELDGKESESAKIPLNSLCPCGSGKKYKNCCYKK